MRNHVWSDCEFYHLIAINKNLYLIFYYSITCTIRFYFLWFPAPRGHRIRIDFRGDFHIEYSQDCAYDFLEFRDGPFGYSPRLGRYCGQIHPPMMESSTRFIWVHFKTDDSIEYNGFRGVYDFFPEEGTGTVLELAFGNKLIRNAKRHKFYWCVKFLCFV